MRILRSTFLGLSFLSLVALVQFAQGQSSTDLPVRIRLAVEAKDWNTAKTTTQNLRSADPGNPRLKRYDYLLGRIAENTAEPSTATAMYEAVVSSNSSLSEYALWRLARLSRAQGDLVLERERLRRLISLAPNSLLLDAARL